MSTRMLIDARHEEETRVSIVRGNRIEDFDYESAAKQQLKGNIYLAKVTRVEPSLQAAFVEYGGNRHGFLAFSEIHPDYYQIPVEDRQALIEAEREAAKQAEAVIEDEAEAAPDAAEGDDVPEIQEADDGVPEQRRPNAYELRRKYKIQEVIKRRQILLIQVVKEERGNKGAALTTYLSLAGRYCVLMPNATSGGGISRKISSAADRKRLKTIMSALDVPDHMGCIIRTAGLSRTKSEIKRDFDYLIRLWDDIRTLTLESVAPCLIYEEASLIKRSIRDLYTREIDEVWVEGETGYKTAKSMMRMLMPSHAKKVQHYKDPIPLFYRYQVEQQLESMYNPTVELRSGGYVVINPTEALIAIDVNSGRSTREHNIEETALKTNLEAADEIARQLRLRDMAGLVVIDFIDMDNRGNNRAVERRIKDALKSDRARIQVGRISSFGLMEMSRQRLRPNLLEASMIPCPHCGGTGNVRSVENQAIRILRQVEGEGIRARSAEVTVEASPQTVFYLLNRKRAMLTDLEKQYELQIVLEASDEFGSDGFRIERLARGADKPVEATVVRADDGSDRPAPPPPESAPRQASFERPSDDSQDDEGGGKKRRRRRRRRRRPGEEGRPEADAATENSDDASDSDGADQAAISDADGEAKADGENRPKRRRRVRKRKDSETETSEAKTADDAASDTDAQGDEPPKSRRRVRRKPADADATDSHEDAPSEASGSEADAGQAETATDQSAEAAAPKRRRVRKKPAGDGETVGTEAAEATETPRPPRRRRSAAAKEQEPAPSENKDQPIPADTASEPEMPAAKRAPGVAAADSNGDIVLAKDKGGVERQTIGSENPAPDGSSEPPSKKKGWWQRVVGG